MQKTLQRLVYSSLGNYSTLYRRRYTQTWHCDSKAAVEQYMREHPLLGPLASFIHVGIYVDNWRRIPLDIQRDPVTGGYWHVAINDGRTPVPVVWTRRDTGPLAKRLVEDVEPGARLLGCSEMISRRNMMATLSRVLGIELAGDQGIRQVSDEEFMVMIRGRDEHKEHVLQIWQMLRDLDMMAGIPTQSILRI